MLDAGTYRAHAIEAALGETDTGKEQIAVRFKLLDVEGQEITWYGYFTDKTQETTFRALRTAGWKGQDLMDLSDLCNPQTAPEVFLVVEHETYEGKTSAKVRWVNGTGGLALKKALDPNKAKTFAARMKGQIAAFDRSAGTPKPAPKNGHTGGEHDPERLDRRAREEGHGPDDIPF
jgi:hypothetical protein